MMKIDAAEGGENVTNVCRAIFKAIHEGKWLSIEYKNQNEQVTKYWIAVKTLSPKTGWMTVDGLHIGKFSVQELKIRLNGIQTASVIEGSWRPVNEALVQDILEHPGQYQALFGNTFNLRVLEYLTMCHKRDSTPYQTDYALIRHLDGDRFVDGELDLTQEQFGKIVQQFQWRTEQKQPGQPLKIRQLALNLLSVETEKGLYVLAYHPLLLDVANRKLRTSEEAVVCREFTMEGTKISAHAFLDAEDYVLLDDFEANAEQIKDCITRTSCYRGVNDMPYLIAIGRDCLLDLDHEYKGITAMFESPDGEETSAPIRAFFGEMTSRPRRRKSFPLALMNNQANLDQMLAINNAMRYPLAYVQGPPGTGKTSTIVNTMTTAFFNDRTVLFASYNNHPINGVVEKLQNMTYRGRKIPFPIVRLGNRECVKEALKSIRQRYEACSGGQYLRSPVSLYQRNPDQLFQPEIAPAAWRSRAQTTVSR